MSIGDLAARVRTIPAGPEALAAADHNVLLPLANGEFIIALDAVARTDETLRAVAARSYHHPNGFDKIVLCSTTKREPELRLHIWWPERSGQGGEHIHNHPWHFRSVIVAGALETTFFELDERGQPYLQYRFGPPAREGADGYRVQHIGESRLTAAFDGQLAAGTIYSLGPSILHRARGIRGALTATLVLQGAFITEPSDVYVTEPLPPVTDAPVRHFTPAELREKITRLVMTYQAS